MSRSLQPNVSLLETFALLHRGEGAGDETDAGLTLGHDRRCGQKECKALQACMM